jgi:hypothetical protein
LGKILRIDVDNEDSGKNYAIPSDNPFYNSSNGAPEICKLTRKYSLFTTELKGHGD